MIKKILNSKHASKVLKSEIFNQAAKYFVVGGVCTVFDFSMLFVFTHFIEINYLISSILAFSISSVVNYLLCISWVFTVRTVQKQHHELIVYILLSGIGLAISTSLIWTLTEFVGLYYMLSKLIATCITFGVNFTSRKFLLHTKKK